MSETFPRPKVSICVPLKNRTSISVEHAGKPLLLKLFANGARRLFEIIEPDDHWEVVVADFHSDDVNVAEFLSGLRSHYRCPNLEVKHMMVEGKYNLGKARNLAAVHASADILFFMDADMTFANRLVFDTAYQIVGGAGKVYFPIVETYLGPGHENHKPRPTGKGNVFMLRRHWEQRKWAELDHWGREDDQMFDFFDAKRLAYRDQAGSLFHQWHPNDLAFKSRYLGQGLHSEKQTFARPEYRMWDERIFHEVNQLNCYRLPTAFAPDDVIIDIGAHIGSFAYACLKRGCGQVLAYEPDPLNFAKLKANLSPFAQRVQLFEKAVWRSDAPQRRLPMRQFGRSDPAANTGLGSLAIQGCADAQVETVSLDEILTACNAPVRLLKLDCEGGEYPILYTSKKLAKVQTVVTEYHTFDWLPGALVPGHKPDPENLKALFQAQGFSVQSTGNARFGYIWAARPAWDHIESAPSGRIPRKIHFVWLGSPLPTLYEEMIQRCRKLHPDWQVRVWSEQEVLGLVASMRTVLDGRLRQPSLSLSTKADLARYHIIAQEGGIYLDTDFFILQGLEPLRNCSLFGVYEQSSVVCCGVFGAVPGHPLFARIFEHLRTADFTLAPNLLAGPRMFSPLCREHVESDSKAQLLPPRSFFPVSFERKHVLSAWRTCNLRDSYGAHLWAHSWGKHGGDAESTLMARVEALLENPSVCCERATS